MDLAAYRSFTERLVAAVSAEPGALGLIAVGSMADRDTHPDEWSDHDFLVVVAPGAQEALRQRADWLPDHERLVYRFRETPHGLKALYQSGHLIEYAVFDPDELYLGRFNRYRVLLDRADLGRRMEEIVRATTAWSREAAPDDAYAIGQVVTGALVAHGRWMRGERLSARAFLIGVALPPLVRLLARYAPAEGAALLDNLDPLRRFDLVDQGLGAALDEALERPLPAAVAGLLELARRELAGRMPAFPEAAVAAVLRRIA